MEFEKEKMIIVQKWRKFGKHGQTDHGHVFAVVKRSQTHVFLSRINLVLRTINVSLNVGTITQKLVGDLIRITNLQFERYYREYTNPTIQISTNMDVWTAHEEKAWRLYLKERNELKDVLGLNYITDFISDEEQKQFLEIIDSEPWLCDLKRRVQHYGYKYDYKKRKIDNSMYLGEFPIWLKSVIEKLTDSGLVSQTPDQVIVNEYLAGQGISDHIDCEPCFHDQIISISLGSHCMMEFKKGNSKAQLILQPKSILIIEGDARHKWTHGIPSRKSDKIGDQVIKRERRVSLTFRKVITE